MEGGKITAFSMKDMPSCFIKTTVAAHAVVRTCLPACPTFQFTLTFACPPSGFPLRKAKFDRSRFSLCFLFVYIYTASCKHQFEMLPWQIELKVPCFFSLTELLHPQLLNYSIVLDWFNVQRSIQKVKLQLMDALLHHYLQFSFSSQHCLHLTWTFQSSKRGFNIIFPALSMFIYKDLEAQIFQQDRSSLHDNVSALFMGLFALECMLTGSGAQRCHGNKTLNRQ